MRSAVPRAWVRARRTILSADAVTFLAAAILYVLAVGDVKGFAFTLGLSTVLDLVVVFLFTHPLVAVLARFKTFGSSGFPASARWRHLADRAASATTGGRDSWAPAPAPARTGARHDPPRLREQPPDRGRRSSPSAPTPASSRHANAVVEEAAASADEEALADAGLSREGGDGGRRRPPARQRGLAGTPALQRRGRARRRRPPQADYKITAVVVLVASLSMVFRGFNFGIDFAGGNSFRVPATASSSPRSEGRRGRRGRRRHRAGGRRQHRCCAPASSTPPSRHRRRRGRAGGRGPRRARSARTR